MFWVKLSSVTLSSNYHGLILPSKDECGVIQHLQRVQAVQIELSITPDDVVVHTHELIARRRVMCVGQTQFELTLVSHYDAPRNDEL